MSEESKNTFLGALEANNHVLMRQMIDSEQVNVNDRITSGNYRNKVFLHIALINYFYISKTKSPKVPECVETIRILLHAGADANGVLHSEGWGLMLLDWAFAIEEPHALDIFDMFIVHGADVNQDRSLIFYFVSNDLFGYFERLRKSLYLLLCHGAYTTKANHLNHPFLVNEWPLLQILYCLQCKSLNYLF